MTIQWRKTYDLKTKGKQHFRVYVSQQEGGLFSSSCLWYEGERALRAPGEPGALTFKLENRAALSEQEALDAILAWAKEKFGNDVTLSEA